MKVKIQAPADRDIQISTTWGYGKFIPRGKTAEVLPAVARLAVDMGAKAVDETVLSPPEDTTEIDTCVAALIRRGDVSHFSRNGKLKAAALSEALGRPVSADETRRAVERVTNNGE